MNKKNLLISWESHRAGDDVLIKAIESLKIKRFKISKVLYLTDQENKKNITSEHKNINIELVPIFYLEEDFGSILNSE